MISVLSGSISVYIDKTDDVSELKHKQFYSIGYNLHNHIFVKIDPKEYNISSGALYFRVNNTNLDPCSYIINIYKNNISMPIELGISKYIEMD